MKVSESKQRQGPPWRASVELGALRSITTSTRVWRFGVTLLTRSWFRAGFLNLALLIFGAGPLLVMGAVMCIVGSFWQQPWPPYSRRQCPSICPSSEDNHKYPLDIVKGPRGWAMGQNHTWLGIIYIKMATNESYLCILPVFLHYEYGDTVFPGVSFKAFLFGFLCQNEETEGMLLMISYSLISFLPSYSHLPGFCFVFFLSFLFLLSYRIALGSQFTLFSHCTNSTDVHFSITITKKYFLTGGLY